ncbi:hypothetical protein [Lentzea tibetensis]|nr:hypothetical protein [Lentzea tibetensis]
MSAGIIVLPYQAILPILRAIWSRVVATDWNGAISHDTKQDACMVHKF